MDAADEMVDIVRWLPELAADSDLTEEPWNRVDQLSLRLEEILTAVLAQERDQRAAAYRAQREELARLQRELVEIAQQLPQPRTANAPSSANADHDGAVLIGSSK